MKVVRKMIAGLLTLIQVGLILTVISPVMADSDVARNKQEHLVMLEQPRVIYAAESVQLNLNLPSGEYEFSPVFRPVDERTQKIEYSILLNGSLPFKEAALLTASVWYQDIGTVGVLSTGDETAPKQKQMDGWMKCFAADKTGIRIDPYTITIGSGIQTLTVTGIGDAFELAGFSFSKPQTAESYVDVSSAYEGYSKYDGEPIIIEGESPICRNDYSLTAKSDNATISITPCDAENSVINYIGGTNWSKPNQELVWQVNAPHDGLYAIAFSFKQNTVTNGSSFRSLKIDGVSPFSEAKTIGFPYKTSWQQLTLSDTDGKDLLFYLSAGQHELSLAVTLGSAADIYRRLRNMCEEIGDMYLDIVMITGETPDSNRDYELYKQIPQYEQKLKGFYNELSTLSYDLQSQNDVNGELDAAVQNMMRVCKQMREKRYESHLFLDTYYSYYQTLSSWLFDIKNMSLSIDKIILCAPDKTYAQDRGFLKGITFSVKRFISSFAGDYSVDSIRDNNAESIKIWANWGRDQVKVLNTLIQESFSADTGINVKVQQVNASLIQGIISKNSPDLYLQLSRTEPVNLAMRGVLQELSSFEDFSEVLDNFIDGAEVPYRYQGGCYALPDTQNFNVMFCRNDILSQLGLEAPETWDDFLKVTAVVQRNNMNTYLPYTRITSAVTVNTGAGGLSVFPTLLMQSGESLYDDSLEKTRLSSEISVQVFKFWTDFYTRYKLNPDVSFYQRFRVGTIPVGIAAYTNYLTFSVAAPEIEGKWSVYPIPGTIRKDSGVSHVTSGSGTGCAIMKSSNHKAAAWKFLKWWVSEDTQYNYSANVEAVLGQSGRIATSNVKALTRLSWDAQTLSTILKQWENVQELAEVPGSYYVSRSIDQAFWAVYNRTMTEKESISEWGRISDAEIKRKIAEYSDSKN